MSMYSVPKHRFTDIEVYSLYTPFTTRGLSKLLT